MKKFYGGGSIFTWLGLILFSGSGYVHSSYGNYDTASIYLLVLMFLGLYNNADIQFYKVKGIAKSFEKSAKDSLSMASEMHILNITRSNIINKLNDRIALLEKDKDELTDIKSSLQGVNIIIGRSVDIQKEKINELSVACYNLEQEKDDNLEIIDALNTVAEKTDRVIHDQGMEITKLAKDNVELREYANTLLEELTEKGLETGELKLNLKTLTDSINGPLRG